MVPNMVQVWGGDDVGVSGEKTVPVRALLDCIVKRSQEILDEREDLLTRKTLEVAARPSHESEAPWALGMLSPELLAEVGGHLTGFGFLDYSIMEFPSKICK